MTAPLPIAWIASSLRAALRDLRRCSYVHKSEVQSHEVALEQIYALLDELEKHGAKEREAANDG